METFDRLIGIMERLRAPGGCPWDAQQDHHSLARHAVEEAYELVDAIESDDAAHIREELGDVLLQVVFHSLIARDGGTFTLTEVIDGLCEKLIHRHPHVFGELQVADAGEVVRNWELLKRQEPGKGERSSLLDGIPQGLPALLMARKLQGAAARVGFDWPDISGVFDKLKEETEELTRAVEARATEQIAEEIGDLLFCVVNLARFLQVDPELGLEEMDRIWEQTKKEGD